METVVAGAPLPVMWVIVSLGAPLPAYSPAATPFAADFGLPTGNWLDGLAATLVCVGVGGIAATGDGGGGHWKLRVSCSVGHQLGLHHANVIFFREEQRFELSYATTLPATFQLRLLNLRSIAAAAGLARVAEHHRLKGFDLVFRLPTFVHG